MFLPASRCHMPWTENQTWANSKDCCRASSSVMIPVSGIVLSRKMEDHADNAHPAKSELQNQVWPGLLARNAARPHLAAYQWAEAEQRTLASEWNYWRGPQTKGLFVCSIEMPRTWYKSSSILTCGWFYQWAIKSLSCRLDNNIVLVERQMGRNLPQLQWHHQVISRILSSSHLCINLHQLCRHTVLEKL